MGTTQLTDRFGRKLTYLRISVTDRCNFRCLYCMPPEGLACLPQEDHLTPAEFERFALVACGAGIERIRITGGEPLVRPDLPDIVSRLSAVPGLKDLALTTNGARLATLAGELRGAGLQRLNVSLDSLNPETFARMTRGARLSDVIAGIEAALKEGFPLKINAVVMRGLNEGEISDFIAFAVEHGVEVRFIEFMPLCGSGWRPESVAPFAELVPDIVARHGMTRILGPADEVARRYLVTRGGRSAKIGFIPSLSEPFCGNCSRLRLTANGDIRPCLFSETSVPVGRALRDGAPDDVILSAIKAAVWSKPKGNAFAEAMASGGGEHLGEIAATADYPRIRAVGG